MAVAAKPPLRTRPTRAPSFCQACGVEIPYGGRGRPKKLCDPCWALANPDLAPAKVAEVVSFPMRFAPRRSGGREGWDTDPEVARTAGRKIPGWPGTVAGRYRPWTVDHFRKWCEQLIFEDGEHHPPEGWQLEVVSDLFAGFEEVWLVVPEGNSKTTLISEFGLYHLDNTRYPWVPVGAHSRDQAEILFGQAQGFVERSLCVHEKLPDECCGVPGLKWDRNLNPRGPFHLAGNRQIRHAHNGGKGMKVYAADVETADGVIPTLGLLDEGHRHKDLGLYRTWKGKCNKRHGQVVMISTAGEPGGDFEKTRENLRQQADTKSREHECHLRASTETTVIHEYALVMPSKAKDLELVKLANPLSTITVESLRKKLASPSLNYGESWLRLTCNIPSRSEKAAVSELDWDRAYTDERIPEKQPVIVGADFAFVMDTTAIVPLWIKGPHERIVDRVEILVPPRDGSMLDPQEVRNAFHKIHERNPILAVIMDKAKAQDTMLWLQETIGCVVVDRTQTSNLAIEDYEALMEALRGGAPEDEEVREPWLRHNGDPRLREHVMNAIVRKLPGDRWRFDRATPTRAAALQDTRVIDALTALGMVNLTAATGWGVAAAPLVALAGKKGPTELALDRRARKVLPRACACGHNWENHEGPGLGECTICHMAEDTSCMTFTSVA